MGSINSKSDKDLVYRENISDEELELLKKAAYGAIFYNKDTELGLVVRYWNEGSTDKFTVLGVLPKNIYQLSEFNIGMMGGIQVLDGKYLEHQARTAFIPYNECTKEQKELIDNKKIEINDFRNNVRNNPTEAKRLGHISLPMYVQTSIVKDEVPASRDVEKILSGEISESKYFEIGDMMEIPITKEILAEIGLVPDDKFIWQEDGRTSEVSPKDISEADMENSLTTKDMGIFWKVIEFFKSLLKGKGEK